VGLLAFGLLRRGSRRLLAGGLVGLLLALALVAALRGPKLWSGTDPGSPWRLRAGNFRVAWSMYLDHPWLGSGPGGFAERFASYREPGDNETRHAHNLPLEFAAEVGTAGLLVGAPLFYVLFAGPLLRRRPPGSSRWQEGLALGLAVFAVQNLADFTAFFPSLLWLAALLRGSLRAETQADPAPADPRLAGAAALAVVAVAATLAGMSGLASDARHAARQAAFASEHAAAARLTRRATSLAPWDPGGWIQRAQATLGPGGGAATDVDALRVALAQAERAVRLSPVRPEARWLRGRVRLALGDGPGAYADLAEAARLYPMKTSYAANRDSLARALGAPPPEVPR
jgi:hypothetical protein